MATGVLFGGGVIAIAGRHFSRGGQHLFCMYFLRDGVRIAAREQIVVRHDGKAKKAVQGKPFFEDKIRSSLCPTLMGVNNSNATDA